MFNDDFERDQERRLKESDEQALEWDMDCNDLHQMCQRWGVKQVLRELERIEPNLQWSIPSQAYLTGAYDDPNPGITVDEIW